MQKSNDMPQPGSPPNENKIWALACFSCASIKVVCGFWFSCPSEGLETEQKSNTRADIKLFFVVVGHNSLPVPG